MTRDLKDIYNVNDTRFSEKIIHNMMVHDNTNTYVDGNHPNDYLIKYKRER